MLQFMSAGVLDIFSFRFILHSVGKKIKEGCDRGIKDRKVHSQQK